MKKTIVALLLMTIVPSVFASDKYECHIDYKRKISIYRSKNVGKSPESAVVPAIPKDQYLTTDTVMNSVDILSFHVKAKSERDAFLKILNLNGLSISHNPVYFTNRGDLVDSRRVFEELYYGVRSNVHAEVQVIDFPSSKQHEVAQFARSSDNLEKDKKQYLKERKKLVQQNKRTSMALKEMGIESQLDWTETFDEGFYLRSLDATYEMLKNHIKCIKE